MAGVACAGGAFSGSSQCSVYKYAVLVLDSYSSTTEFRPTPVDLYSSTIIPVPGLYAVLLVSTRTLFRTQHTEQLYQELQKTTPAQTPYPTLF